jgi:DNA-directed RNA polymerase specialized sigma24 family protein
MSPRNDEKLLNDVIPRLRKAVHTIRKVGCEDDEELVQDTTLMAARLMDSAENAGHPITAGNASFYAVKAARSGRRSYYSGRSDAYSAGCQLDGNAIHEHLDDEVEFESGDYGTLHDIISPFDPNTHEADPSEEAARNLDWQAYLASHPPRHRTAILVLVDGGTMREAGLRCGLKDAAASKLKRRIAADLIAYFGEEVIRRLIDGRRPGWESDLRMTRERHLCHSGWSVLPSNNPANPVS